jgi:hypothetical protein
MIGFRFTEGTGMKNETDEMEKLNQLVDGYGQSLKAKEYGDCLEYLWAAQRYLDSLPYDTPMYRNGHKWTRAGEMAEFNRKRTAMIQRMAGGRKW